MPVKVHSGGTDYYLLPAPLVSIDNPIIRNGEGQKIGTQYNITLDGDFLNNKGNPIVSATGSVTSSFSSDSWVTTQTPDDDPLNTDVDETNAATVIMAKQEKIRWLFAQGEAVDLEITGFNESKGWKFYCTVDNVSFSNDGRWAVKGDYQIQLTAYLVKESINGDFSDNSNEHQFTRYVSSVDDNWSIEETDQKIVATGDFSSVEKVFTITHNANAVGQRVFSDGSGTFLDGLNPWQQASGYVHAFIGTGFASFPSGYIDPVNRCGYGAYNYAMSENIDKSAGSYGITETWTVLPTGQTAIEDFSYTVDGDEGAITRVSARGTITGLNNSGVTSCFNDAYTNAETYYNNNVVNKLHARVKELSGQTCLNSSPVSTSVGHNPAAGQITFDYLFDTRPAVNISGALTENIQISDVYPGQNVAIVPVIGRSQPILQYVNSRSEYRRSMQVDVVMPLSGCTPRKPTDAEMTTIFDLYNPAGDPNVKVEKVFYQSPRENWNPRTGQYSYTIEFIYETSG